MLMSLMADSSGRRIRIRFADSLQPPPVWINDKRRIVVRTVLGPQPGLAIALAAMKQRGGMKTLDGSPSRRVERDVGTGAGRVRVVAALEDVHHLVVRVRAESKLP